MKEIDPNKEPDRKRLIEASIRVANVKAAAHRYELSEDEHIIYPINSSWTAGFVEAVVTMVEDQRAANFILNEAGILKETPSPKPTKQKNQNRLTEDEKVLDETKEQQIETAIAKAKEAVDIFGNLHLPLRPLLNLMMVHYQVIALKEEMENGSK